jgi:hypothetical protein
MTAIAMHCNTATKEGHFLKTHEDGTCFSNVSYKHQGMEETAPDMRVATTILTTQLGQAKRVGPLPQ